MDLQFLGTGAGVPSKTRNTQSFVFNFMQDLHECWMFDCGEATQHQILRTTIKPTKISRIFISHMHGDHILGLIGFLSSRSFLLAEDASPMIIYGPKGIKDFVTFNLNATRTTLAYKVDFVEFFDKQCIINNKKVSVYTYPLKHQVDSYGFKIVFSDEVGSLKVDKLKELGINPGPFYKQIKENETFEYLGKIYNSSDYLTEKKKGKSISIIPDTVYFNELKDFVKNSEILITECTYLQSKDSGLARRNTHLSIEDVKELAVEEKLQKIFLTHISARYTREDEQNAISSINEINNECEVIVAKDLDLYNL